MFKILVLMLFPVLGQATDGCQVEFDLRGKSATATETAVRCYTEAMKQPLGRADRAHALTQLSYLKFFHAENFTAQKEKFLLDAMNTAEEAVLLFGSKYSLSEYRKLSSEEQKSLANALYTYGLVVARYVDEKGIVEALKRMDDIKKSMTTILRLKQDAVAYHGAHRVLGIFHMKVPAIAGGDINISKTYLPKAIASTLYSGRISRYPLNHLVYSDLLFKLGQNSESCEQLRLIAGLTADDVRALDNGLTFESLQNIQTAKKQMIERKCAQ